MGHRTAVSYCISGLLLARKYPIVLLNVGASSSSYAAMLRIAKTGNDLGFRSADSDERGDHLNLPGKPKTMERERERKFFGKGLDYSAISDYAD